VWRLPLIEGVCLGGLVGLPIGEYIALVKPRIMLLLVFTAAASYLLSASLVVDGWALSSLVAVGALASGGSMAINDYLDRDIDSRIPWLMRRRPLAAGRMGEKGALALGLTLILTSALMGLLTLPLLSVSFVLSGIAFYTVFYTMYLKRRHWLNIVLGGFAGSLASLAGWAAGGPLDWYGWALAALIFIWTPGHFWSLALRYRAQYARAGIPMLPDLIPERRAGVVIFANVLLTAVFSMGAFVGLAGRLYFVTAAVVNLLVLAATLPIIRNPDSRNAWRSFKASSPHLYLILLLLLLDRFFEASP
jgi:protoheme IX farnesyltransferase